MTLKSSVRVQIETHEASFGDLMNQIRSWLASLASLLVVENSAVSARWA